MTSLDTAPARPVIGWIGPSLLPALPKIAAVRALLARVADTLYPSTGGEKPALIAPALLTYRGYVEPRNIRLNSVSGHQVWLRVRM